MSGLLDSLSEKDPATMQGLLQMGLALMQSRGNFGNALGQAGMQGLQGAQQYRQNQYQNQMQALQMEHLKSQSAMDQAKAARMNGLLDNLKSWSAGAAGDTPGANADTLAQTGSLAPTNANAAVQGPALQARQQANPLFGIPAQAIQADLAFNDGKNIPDYLFKRGSPDMQVTNGYAYDKNRVQGGFMPGMQTSANGQSTLTTIGPNGLPVVSSPTGALQTQAQQTIATELPKALINGGIKREDFVNPDGTTRSVSGLQFLQESGGLQSLLGTLGQSGATPQPTSQPAPQRAAPAVPAMPAQRGAAVPQPLQVARDSERVAILRQELAKATDPGDRAALQREIDGTQGGQTGVRSGIPTQAKVATEAQGKINDTWLKTSYEPAISAAGVARDSLTAIKTARFALQGLGDTGFGTGAKVAAARVLAAIGVPNAEQFATNGAVFQQAAGARLLAVLGEQNGVQTEGDANRAKQIFASVASPKQANQFILDMAQAKAEWDQKRAAYFQEAMPYAQKQGDLQEIDRRWQRIAPSVFDLPSMQVWKARIK